MKGTILVTYSAAQLVADRIGPRDTAVFHGYINPDRLNVIEKTMLKSMKKEFGDFRDWDSIITWATKIASTLKAGGPEG